MPFDAITPPARASSRFSQETRLVLKAPWPPGIGPWFPMDDLLRFRKEFPILERTTYLISNSLGAMPRRARDGLMRYADEWERRGVRAWSETWWDSSARVGDKVAP